MGPENPYTHQHGWVGCYLADGVDPTAPPIALSPGALNRLAAPPLTFALPDSGVVVSSLMAYLTVAVAYFALGVAVGALVQRFRRVQTVALVVLVVPGVLAGLGLLAWIIYSLRA